MIPSTTTATSPRSILLRLRDMMLAVWIAGTTLFFLFRFGFAFYRDNETAIQHLLEGFK